MNEKERGEFLFLLDEFRMNISFSGRYDLKQKVLAFVEERIRQAVSAERERCVLLAADVRDQYRDMKEAMGGDDFGMNEHAQYAVDQVLAAICSR